MLKKEDLSQAMGALDDEMIEETDALRKKAKRKRPRLPAWVYAAAAAVLLIASLGVFRLIRGGAPASTDPEDVSGSSAEIHNSMETDVSQTASTEEV